MNVERYGVFKPTISTISRVDIHGHGLSVADTEDLRIQRLVNL